MGGEKEGGEKEGGEKEGGEKEGGEKEGGEKEGGGLMYTHYINHNLALWLALGGQIFIRYNYCSLMQP